MSDGLVWSVAENNVGEILIWQFSNDLLPILPNLVYCQI